jgi:hypothetical protein
MNAAASGKRNSISGIYDLSISSTPVFILEQKGYRSQARLVRVFGSAPLASW